MRRILLIIACFWALQGTALGQSHDNYQAEEQHATEAHAQHDEHAGHETAHHDEDVDHAAHGDLCAHAGGHHETEFDPAATAYHHISDANVYTIGPWAFPLPCILYSKEDGWSVFMSSRFGIGHHGNGHKAYKRYVLDEGVVKRIKDPSFPMDEVEIDGIVHQEVHTADGKKKVVAYVCYDGQAFETENKSTADFGMFGGGITSFYDFSITKNVASMILVAILLGWMFIYIARKYEERDGKAPAGLQSFIEPIFIFIQDEVAKPFLGDKWEKFLPFLQALFFFILGLNLFGQIPFLGGSNVTGNLAVTGALAIITFIVVNINGNAHYWKHIFALPGVPKPLLVIMTPVEIIGLFIKPLTLMLRLFANITAGHMVILIFISLIFIFGQSGENVGGALGAAVGSTLLTMFMMSIELLVAFIQAFVFTILTASYLGAATEEEHH